MTTFWVIVIFIGVCVMMPFALLGDWIRSSFFSELMTRETRRKHQEPPPWE